MLTGDFCRGLENGTAHCPDRNERHHQRLQQYHRVDSGRQSKIDMLQFADNIEIAEDALVKDLAVAIWRHQRTAISGTGTAAKETIETRLLKTNAFELMKAEQQSDEVDLDAEGEKR